MDAAGAGSLEQPAPSLPPGALWLEGKRQQDGATGGPGPRQVAGRGKGSSKGGTAGTRSLSGYSGAVCPGPPRLQCGALHRPSVGPFAWRATGTQRLPSPLPPSRHPSHSQVGNPRSRNERAGLGQPPRRALRANLAEPRLRSAADSRRSRKGTFRPALETGTPGHAARVSDRPRERKVALGNYAFVRPETSQFLRTEARDGGEAGSGSTLSLPNVLAAVLGPEFTFSFAFSPFELQLRSEAGFSDPSRLGNGSDGGGRSGGWLSDSKMDQEPRYGRVRRQEAALSARQSVSPHPSLLHTACERFLLKSRGKRVRVRLQNRLRHGHKSQH